VHVDGRLRGVRWLERALLVLGVACLGYYAYRTVEAESFQRQQTAAFETRLDDAEKASRSDTPVHATQGTSERRHVAAPRSRPAVAHSDDVIALLEIPRLKLSSPVVSGDDDQVLDVAIGHLPDTPRPWESGNSALAAHRDGLFRSLRHVRLGDIVRLRTEHGEFEYEVRDTRIVQPTDLSVLKPTNERVLTLITCYPFSFIGSAPQRFVVRAEELR
jgi:sortase A